MDCREDLDFHDDSGAVAGKAKESILLMKKKMFLSHDLILQYNNKLKECDRLKGELCTMVEEVTKLKRESNLNVAKVIKLETRITDYKKNQLELENKISNQDIIIAGDKSHVQQLVCKLEELEEKNSGMAIEADIQKSSLEEKIKGLEQELRKLKKSQTGENPGKLQRGKRVLDKNQIIEKETNDIGINTTEVHVTLKPIKPSTADKCVLTDEFYHIKDNPYPIFCEKCEALTVPNFEKFFKTMTTHPPLLDEILSPPRPTERPLVNASSNFDDPFDSIANNGSSVYRASPMNLVVPEIENLKHKIATLERKMKKRKKQHSRESQNQSTNCCGHSYAGNCCSHGTSHGGTMPNALPNVQTDLMTEFWNRIMKFTNDSMPPKHDTSRVRNKRKKKLLKLNKQKIRESMKKRSNECGTRRKWEIEFNNCPNERESMNNSVEPNSDGSHILRLKPCDHSDARASMTEFRMSDTRANKQSLEKDTLESSTSNIRERSCSPDPVDEFSERDKLTRNKMRIGVSQKSKGIIRSRKTAKANITFSGDAKSENVQGKKKLAGEINLTRVSQRRSSSRIQEKSLRTRVRDEKTSRNESLSVSSDLGFGYSESTNISQFSTRKSRSISSEAEPRDADSAYCSQNSANTDISRSSNYNFPKDHPQKSNNTSVTIPFNDSDQCSLSANNFSHQNSQHDKFPESDDDSSYAPLEHCSDEETLDNTRFAAVQGNTRKRKRADSPKATKRTVRSKLLCKLRALKKNSIISVSNGSAHSVSDERSQCSLSEERKISNESENECKDVLRSNDTVIEAPAKKQRIAHKPKNEQECYQTMKMKIAKLPKNSEGKSSDNCSTVPTAESSLNHHLTLDGLRKNSTTHDNASLTDHSLSIFNSLSTKATDASIPALATSDTSKCCNIGNKLTARLKSLESTRKDQDFNENEEISEKCTFKDEKENLSKVHSIETSKLEDAKCPDDTRVKDERKIVFESAELVACPITSATRTPIICERPDTPAFYTSTSLSSSPATLPVSLHRSSVTSSNIFESPIPSLFDRKIKTSATAKCDNSLVSFDASQISQLPVSTTVGDSTRQQAKKLDDHLSIYENALPSSSTAENRQDSQSVMTRRPLLTYQTDMLVDYQETNDECDSRSTSNSEQYTIDSSDTMRNNESEKSGKRLVKLQNVVKDLRTRQVLCKAEIANASFSDQSQEKINNLSNDDTTACVPIDAATYQRGIRCLGTLLTRHLNDVKKKIGPKTASLRRNAAKKLQLEAEKTVRHELDRLVESEEWTVAINAEVVAKLRQVSTPRTISKCIVDLLIERAKIGESLDRTYTPPAPVMTKSQQRIVTLINGLERDSSVSGVFEFVRAGIDFNLFRLGQPVPMEVAEPLARMFTVMTRLRKDRNRVRIFCCDALYFLGRKASTIIYTVLSIWPEVFPMHGSHPDKLANCVLHLIRMEQNAKATSIKKMLKDYYNYPEHQMNSAVMMEESMNALTQEYTDELETVILLIAKREGTEWAYKHVIKGGLEKLVDDNSYPSLSNALTLFGFILRTFPLDDDDKVVETNVEKLCEIIDSAEGSPDKEEGIVSALLSLARHHLQFRKIADTILKWKPSRAMRVTTIEQLSSFFKLRSMDWWNSWKKQAMK